MKAVAASLVTMLALTACQRESAAVAAPEATSYNTHASVQELMHAIVDPAADRVWDSVGTTVTAKGADEKQPKTDEEWREVEGGAITLVEATNLLVMPGRRMVPVNGKMLDEGFEGVLTAAEAQHRLEEQRAVFVQFALSLRDVATRLQKASAERNTEALFNLGTEMDGICEGCHMTFWYPNQPIYKASKGSAPKS
jgi:hypothetical protein